jgi:Domain of unknown function (DUF4129)
MSAPAPRARPSPVLLIALLVALASGAAASLIIGAATAPGAPPVRASEFQLPSVLLGYAMLAVPAFLLALFIYRRVTGGSASLAGRSVVSVLIAVLVAVLLIAALRSFGGGGPEPTGAVAPGHNATGTIPPNTTGTNVTSAPNATSFLIPSLPGWVPFALIAAVAVVVVAVALPFVLTVVEDRRAERRRPPLPPSTAEVRGALVRAMRKLDQGGDPRTVIVGLYGDLLERVSLMVVGLDPETPEEIRRQHLVRLGIHPEAATVLTRLFEEARYSTHPLGPESADRVRRAVEVALADLGRAPVPA